MSQQARDYQNKSITLIKHEFLNGHKRVLLWLATGAGKTFVFCRMVKEAVSRGKKVIIIVRGRKLVDQASRRLFREGVQHGVLMNKHWNYRPNLPVQVCSIDTIISRQLRPEADLIIIDECHLFGIDSKASEFVAQYPNAYIIPVTATPWMAKGLSHLAQKMVHPITMQELIDQGYLTNFRYFAPCEPDLTNVKISNTTKDYVVDQLEGAMVAGQLTGKIVEHYKKIANDSPAICFAVNVHHSKILAEKFNASGIKAEHCEASTPDAEREAIIHRLESGETKVVCNVGILCTGVDIPCIKAIIMARPTKSLNLFIQQAGRGTRPFPCKDNCILLDHAGNIREHGFPTEEHEVDLQGDDGFHHKKKSKICKECFCVFRGNKCPECGTESGQKDVNGKFIEETDDELQEIVTSKEKNPIKDFLKKLERERKSRGYHKGWSWYRLVDQFGYKACEEYLPEWFKNKMGSSKFAFSPYKFR